MNKIAILLSTYNGEKYLHQQLMSIRAQKKVQVSVYAIDDDSIDSTKQILENSNLNIKIFPSQNNKNPTKYFIYLIKNVPKNFDFYCFCDQDDVWLKNKISYSIWKMKINKADILGSRTFLTNKNLKIYGKSPLFKRKICFSNSLVQSIAGGNTNIWSKKFHLILSNLNLNSPASHDWMLYQISTYLGFKYLYLKKPLLLYRQHDQNVVGANNNLRAIIKRIYKAASGRTKDWHDMNFSHLNEIKKLINSKKDEYKQLEGFYNARKIANPLKKIYLIKFKFKIFRQTLLGELYLLCAIIINKI